ncbi:MAG: T9SS type A sorting domain-containing protein [Chlorobi bacterium]|nr:T9SS type A sorting domain-containing protein [Chlorobiota bacterium]
MKKRLLVFATVVFIVFGLNAQTQFENPGFEEWEAISYGPVPEPVNWSSVRSALPDNLAKLAPPVWDSSSDAHSGKYSLYLINKSTFGIVATGTMTCGRLFADLDPGKGFTFTDTHDGKYNTPLTHRPDSITGWYKCNPKSGDFPTLKVILHTDSANFPTNDSTNWIAYAFHSFPATPVETWTRFSIPFNYLKEGNPEYILALLTAGNGVSAVADSEAWFDDLALIYNDGTDITEITPNDLKVFMNQKVLTVYIDDDHNSGVRLQVFDITGRPVHSSDIVSGIQCRIPLDVPAGVYIVVANIGPKVLTRKVLIK